jgi:hypothetical protein
MNDQMYSYELRWIFHQMCVVVAVLFCCHRGEKCRTFKVTDDTRRTHVEIQFSEILSLTVEFN